MDKWARGDGGALVPYSYVVGAPYLYPIRGVSTRVTTSKPSPGRIRKGELWSELSGLPFFPV